MEVQLLLLIHSLQTSLAGFIFKANTELAMILRGAGKKEEAKKRKWLFVSSWPSKRGGEKISFIDKSAHLIARTIFACKSEMMTTPLNFTIERRIIGCD